MVAEPVEAWLLSLSKHVKAGQPVLSWSGGENTDIVDLDTV
jgi:hypothetical protein